VIGRVVVGSKNADKIAEIEAVLVPMGVEIVRGLTWSDVDETQPTLEGNAILKATAVLDATGVPAIADDTGLEVHALGGAPGVITARYAGQDATYEDHVSELLADMRNVGDDRRATFRTVMVLARPDAKPLVAHGRLDGRIATSRRGEDGFGYDPVFEIDGVTLAEMGVERKNRISHRARAIAGLVDLIEAAERAGA
jgi:XTP/dITP diphosphohydrolase